MKKLILWMLSIGMVAISSSTHSAEKGDKPASPKEIFKVQGKLTADDPADAVFKQSKHKVHPVKLEAGKYVRIDLTSSDFDAYLHLQDEDGKTLAEDDDGGDGSNSRIVYKIKKPGTYKLVVTSFDKKLSAYNLTVVPAGQDDVLAARLAACPNSARKNATASWPKSPRRSRKKEPASDRRSCASAMDACLGLEKIATVKFDKADVDLAARAFGELGGLLLKSSDRGVVKSADMMLGASRRLKLPGNDMDVKGTKMDGQTIDWKSYRGKVVLVDFWATWCIKCRAELPNVRRNVEAYKDRGFDVVFVSLDQSHDELEEFLAKEKLPGVCLHERLARNGQPLANHYGVMFIPQAILVDRDGKVISLNAHGAELDRLLEKHIGPAKGK